MAASLSPRGPLHILDHRHQGHGTGLRSRPKSGKALRSCVSRNPTRFHLPLTCVDASDNVSFLRTGAIWDPGFLPLLQPEDQIRLGDWVSWPGGKQPAAAGLRWAGAPLAPHGATPAVPTGSSLSLPSSPSFLDQPSRLPASPLGNPTFTSLDFCPGTRSGPAEPLHMLPSPPAPDSSPWRPLGSRRQRPEPDGRLPQHIHRLAALLDHSGDPAP